MVSCDILVSPRGSGNVASASAAAAVPFSGSSQVVVKVLITVPLWLRIRPITSSSSGPTGSQEKFLSVLLVSLL
jgi:hypothetical protein